MCCQSHSYLPAFYEAAFEEVKSSDDSSDEAAICPSGFYMVYMGELMQGVLSGDGDLVPSTRLLTYQIRQACRLPGAAIA